MRKINSLIVFGTLLSGCVSAETMQTIYNSQTPPTPEIRSKAVTYIKETFFDPYSIRDASISGPLTLPGTDVKAVCVRFNAKNRMGGYVGMKPTSLRFQGGNIVSSLEDAPSCNDPRVKYHPFKELENL